MFSMYVKDSINIVNYKCTLSLVYFYLDFRIWYPSHGSAFVQTEIKQNISQQPE